MTTDSDRLETIKALVRRSEYLKAFDLARQTVDEGAASVATRHRGILALASMGATDRAELLFEHWGLDAVGDDEDVLALKGRLRKDKAGLLAGAARRTALIEAAEQYERAFRQGGGGYFPAINVATLNLLAGRREAARDWAGIAAPLAARDPSYYGLATVAEADLVLGDLPAARAGIERAAAAGGSDYAAKASTRRQLALIVRELGLDPALLDPLRPPAVMHFCGHIIAAPGAGGKFPASDEARVAAEIRETIEDQHIRFAFGSLAAGADILFAEAILAAGGELDVILPFDRGDFIAASVETAGPGWVKRFHDCLGKAKEVHYVTEDAFLGHAELFSYAAHLALGLARLRAQHLGAELRQIAVWDGNGPAPGQAAGTAADVAKARAMGIDAHVIRPASPAPEADGAAAAPSDGDGGKAGNRRRRRTMIFGDFKGFSKLGDAQIPPYVEMVLGGCARVLDRHGRHLKFRNTWGDGLFLVFDDLAAAAACAFDLSDEIDRVRRSVEGLPPTLGLRLGMHYGPVFEMADPVLARANYFGFHVSRAARVEPITPEGEVYVTESAAAALAVDAADAFRCDYVGRVPLAKGYGEFPMYSLARLSPG